jgi:isopenicillin N synthase-like dioxygenase
LLRLMAIDISLKQPERLLEAFGGVPQTMKVTHYAPCTQAGEVLGLMPHTDACGLTLLLHVNDVQVLEMRTEDGKWLAVDPPLDGVFIVNIGDIHKVTNTVRSSE